MAQVRYGHPLANRKSILVRELRPYPHVTFADEDITNINYCSDVSQYNPSILEKRIVSGSGHAAAIVDCTDSYYVGCDFTRFSTPACSRVYIPLRTCRLQLNTLWVKSRGRRSRRLSRRLLQNWKTPMKTIAEGLRKDKASEKEDGYERTDKTDSKRL